MNNVIAFPKLSSFFLNEDDDKKPKKKSKVAGKKDALPWEGDKSSMPRGGEDSGEFASNDKVSGPTKKLSKDIGVKAGDAKVWILDQNGEPKKVPPHSPVAKKFLSNPENVKKLQAKMGNVKDLSAAKKDKSEPINTTPKPTDEPKSATDLKPIVPKTEPAAKAEPKSAEQPKKKRGRPAKVQTAKPVEPKSSTSTSTTNAKPNVLAKTDADDSDIDNAFDTLAKSKDNPENLPKQPAGKQPPERRGLGPLNKKKEPNKPSLAPASAQQKGPSAQVKADQDKTQPPSLGRLANREKTGKDVDPADQIKSGPPDLNLSQLYKTVDKTVKDIDSQDPENYPDFAKLARSDLMRKSNFKVQTKQDMDALNLTTLAQAAGLKSKNADDYLQSIYRDKVLGVEEQDSKQKPSLPKLSAKK